MSKVAAVAELEHKVQLQRSEYLMESAEEKAAFRARVKAALVEALGIREDEVSILDSSINAIHGLIIDFQVRIYGFKFLKFELFFVCHVEKPIRGS